MQLPLPEKLRDFTEEILSCIESEKDVDSLNDKNLNKKFVAPIVLALQKVLDFTNEDINKEHINIINKKPGFSKSKFDTHQAHKDNKRAKKLRIDRILNCIFISIILIIHIRFTRLNNFDHQTKPHNPLTLRQLSNCMLAAAVAASPAATQRGADGPPPTPPATVPNIALASHSLSARQGSVSESAGRTPYPGGVS